MLKTHLALRVETDCTQSRGRNPTLSLMFVLPFTTSSISSEDSILTLTNFPSLLAGVYEIRNTGTESEGGITPCDSCSSKAFTCVDCAKVERR